MFFKIVFAVPMNSKQALYSTSMHHSQPQGTLIKRCNISLDFLSIQHCSSDLFYGKVSQNISALVFLELLYFTQHNNYPIYFKFYIKLINNLKNAQWLHEMIL